MLPDLECQARVPLHAIKAGTLRATKRGRDWHITPAAVEAYRSGSLGKPGRRAK
jgi:hypothetical protein